MSKKFWSGLGLSIVGVTITVISFFAFYYADKESWLWSVNSVFAFVGIPIFLSGVGLMILHRKVIN